MADLVGGGGRPAVSNGNGASSSRPTAPPAQTGSPSRGIRGPRMIMQERQEREARQRAEREQIERVRAEEEARLLEEQNRQLLERERRNAAGAAAETGAQQGLDPATQRWQRQTEDRTRPQEGQSRHHRVAQTREPPAGQSSQQRPSRTQPSQAPPPAFSAAPPAAGTAPTGTTAGQTGETSAGGSRPRNSFPHAFERWEALSAHWEGLTSFWIRQLQQRTDEIDRDPLSQQLARQVTDLSAAGANLFHAVVELQRLRASSERKFQRWFFETRAELERHTEVNGMLEAALDEERRGRADAIRDAVEHERANSKTQKQLAEMGKELRISKEEARRAWEELGRREQEERDRTISLQQGHPTVVGGVQVVPMTQGVPSRHGSQRDSRATQSAEASTAEYARGGQEPPAGFYQQPAAAAAGGHERHGSYGGGSEGGYSEGEYAIDAHGNFIRDSTGHRVPFRSAASPGDDHSDEGAEEYETPASQPGTSYPPSSSHHSGAPAPDYAGQGYAAPGWEPVRHHHPTRLSDVIEEEEERSRTSASQVSRG